MIIGENRAQVIENIKAAVKKGKMHAKVELGDPILTKSERIKLVNDYWKQQKKLSHKLNTVIFSFSSMWSNLARSSIRCLSV